MLRYDNEKSKGHHRHVLDVEEPYEFVDVDTLVKDFLEEIDNIRKAK